MSGSHKYIVYLVAIILRTYEVKKCVTYIVCRGNITLIYIIHVFCIKFYSLITKIGQVMRVAKINDLKLCYY